MLLPHDPRSSPLPLLGALLLLASTHLGQSWQALPPRPELEASVRPPTLLVSGYTSGTVHRFDPDTGTPQGDLGSVPGAQSIRTGPDGLLYVCSETNDRVLRFDADGRFVDVFVADDPLTPVNETGGLNGPTAAAFGPDGNLYVASFANDRVLQYDGATGAFRKRFVDSGVSPLNGPDAGMVFGSDGRLYVPSFNNDRVLLYDGLSGDYLGVFADGGTGLSRPRDLKFRGGLLYVSSWGSDEILRYDPVGNLVDVFAVTAEPTGLAFGPHDGDLYVTSDTKSYVKRLDGLTGQQVSKPVGNNSGLLKAGTYLHFLR
jgi:sugar lactone lactonase YvrE